MRNSFNWSEHCFPLVLEVSPAGRGNVGLKFQNLEGLEKEDCCKFEAGLGYGGYRLNKNLVFFCILKLDPVIRHFISFDLGAAGWILSIELS